MSLLRCLALAPAIFLVACGTPVKIIGHRGASYHAPENTLAAVALSYQMKADATEIDVHLSADQRIMVIHDDNTQHTAGVHHKISNTHSDVLRTLDVGKFKGEKFTGEKIPFLEEVIDLIPPGRLLFVEIKCGPEVLPALERVIAASDKRKQIVIIGFGLDTMAAAKKKFPDIPVYWLRGTVQDKETKRSLPHDPEWIKMVRERNLDGLNVHFAGLDENYARQVRKAGLGLYVWTVNDPIEALRMKSLGVDGITTDRPGWMRDLLESR
jgi:glycerophosphoryl diester phosphodiesterase